MIQINKKTIIIAIIIVFLLSFWTYKLFIQDKKSEFILEQVAMGKVVKEVSETGTVRKSEETDLSFKTAGRIEKIYVEVGDMVIAGQELLKLNKTDLLIQLSEAQANLGVAQANYDKLLAGVTEEEIKVAETAVLNAQITLENAQQNLIDVKIDAEEDLENAYEDALNTLDDAYLKIYNSFNVVSSIKRTYFTASDQEGILVTAKKNRIETALNDTENYLNLAKSGSWDDIDTALSEIKDNLSDIQVALEVVRDASETISYRDAVSAADKTSLDNQKSYINTVHTDVVSAQQIISTTKITKKTNNNTAEASVSTAEAQFQKAQDELTLLTAGPRQEDIALYLAQKNQAQAKVSLLQNQIAELSLKAPNDGQVIRIEKRQGETVQAAELVISFLPSAPFQIKVDIYEEDIVDIKEGNLVEINLVAFPDDHLEGKVVLVDPAEKMIDAIVYYEVTIDFVETKQGIKSGMTADIIIKVDEKENVLVVSKRAVNRTDGKKTVQIYEKGKVEQREIKTGLEGDDFFEVISGLEQGEQVVLGERI